MLVSAARRLASAGSSPNEGHAPLVIAHRGATAGAPENSLAAFEAAIAAGVDMIELDVRLTADAVIVVHHGSSVRGTPISRLTYQQLRERRADVTTLADVVALCRDRISVDVEVKTSGIEERIVGLLRGVLEPEQLVVTSLIEGVVANVKRVDPAIVCGLLLSPARFHARAQRFGFYPFDWMKRAGADFILPHQLLVPLRGGSKSRPVRPGLATRAAARGVPLVVWTVNGPERLQRYLADPRIAGVITDVPRLAVSTRVLVANDRARDPSAVTGRSDHAFPRLVRAEHSE
jgi:glycerophosphoryl diester phosphodiesterase